MKRKILLLSLILSILMIVPSFAAVGHINGCTNTDFTENCCTKTFNIVPKAGYRIVDVKINGVSQGAITSYTFTNLTQAQTMKVITELIPETYTITVTQGSNGTISPGTATIESGSSQAFTITPNEGYVIATLVVNGANQTVTNEEGMTYTFSNVTSNKTITATYKEAWAGWNAPKLVSGLTPVNWEGENWVEVNDVANWDYNYLTANNNDGTAVENVSSGNATVAKWANAMTEDGSLYVWIPRYSYQITEENGYNQDVDSWNADEGTNKVGKVEIIFSNGTNDTITSSTGLSKDGYVKHPAFTFGNKELTGIWVAKYEASKGNTTSELAAPTESSYVAKFVPGVSSWRSTSVSKMYDYSYNIFRNADSHLMKNVEWGAVAYLTNAIGRIPYINDNSNYITGIAGSSQNDSSTTTSTTNAWNTANGVKASTTHNVYGIYDLSGGSREYVAAYYTGVSSTYLSGDTSNKTYAGSLYTAANNSSTAKYVDTYSTAYTSAKTGDAVYETSSSSSGKTSWDGDCLYAPNASYPVFVRGGRYNNDSSAGVFCFDAYYGGDRDSDHGFRAVLAIE